jgi:hypothetical protein
MHSLALICMAVLSVAACGRDTNGTGGAGGTAGAGGSAGTGGSGGGMGTTIKNLRMTPPGIGTSVTLNNVVVVQSVTSMKHGDIWVQDMGGGQYSGIHLFCNYGGTTPNCTMTPRASIDALNPGMVINVTGNYKPFTPSQPAGAPTQLEIDAPVITTTTMTATPMPLMVTAADVAKDVAVADSAKYHGVYVKVTPGPFTISSTPAQEFLGTCPIMNDAGATMTYFGVEATGQGKTLSIGLNFHTSSMHMNSLNKCYMDNCFYFCTAANALTNQMFQSISGIVEPDSDASSNVMSFIKIMPTVDADLQ